MKTETPVKLIELLKALLTETEKMNVGRLYISVVEEMNKIHFAETEVNSIPDEIYKHLIQLSIKDFIHSGRSETSARVVNDIIDFISRA
jgi:CxxC motif-containing protein (DUF1111 family)